MRTRTEQIERLLNLQGGDSIGEAEAALLARVASTHSDISQIFAELKRRLESQLDNAGGGDGNEPKKEGK